MGAAHSALAQWTNFYVIAGSSAGALTGLQFVVIALIAQMRTSGSMREIRAFGSPTVVHFCAALLISMILTMPWQALSQAGFCLGLCGTAGIVYALIVIRHARIQTGYEPEFGDWVWFTILPLFAYAALATGGFLLVWDHTWCLFLIAATSLAFLFMGVRNSWDTVTYLAVRHGKDSGSNTT